MTRARARDVAVAAATVASACTTITSTVQHGDRRVVDVSWRTRSLDVGRHLHANGHLDGTDLVVTIREHGFCVIEEVSTHRTDVWVRRHPTPGTTDGQLVGIELGIGALLGLAAWGLFEWADDGCAYTNQETGEVRQNPGLCRGLGYASGGLGGGLVVSGLIDIYRLRDRHEVVTGESRAQVGDREVCMDAPLSEQLVTVRLGNLSREDRTTPDGVVRLSLLQLSASAFEQPPTVTHGKRETVVEVPDEFATDALVALHQAPGSTLARDDAAACEAAVSAASDAGDGALVAAWQRAESTCGARWTPAHAAVREQALIGAAEEAARELVSRGELSTAVRVLTAFPGVAPRLRDDQEILGRLTEAVATAAAVILDGSAEAGAERERLCSARSLFMAIHGKAAWAALLLEIGTRAVKLDGGDPRDVRRRLEQVCGG